MPVSTPDPRRHQHRIFGSAQIGTLCRREVVTGNHVGTVPGGQPFSDGRQIFDVAFPADHQGAPPEDLARRW